MNLPIPKKRAGHAPRDRDFKPVILLTGASSGIGLATARLLAQCEDYRVVITARRISLFQLRREFKDSHRLWVRALDVTEEKQRTQLIQEITEQWGGVDILINNAGISYRAVVEHMTEDDELHQIASNYLGPMALMRAVLPGMRDKGRGKIINISSVSGMLAMPTMSAYTASKYALEGASEALWYEARPFGINVVLLQPGFIRSESFKRVYYTSKSHPAQTQAHPYSDYYENMTPFIEKLMNWSFITPEKMARLLLKVIRWQNPPLRIAATPDAALFGVLRKLIPRRWFQPFLFLFLPKANDWAQTYTKKRVYSLLQRLIARTSPATPQNSQAASKDAGAKDPSAKDPATKDPVAMASPKDPQSTVENSNPEPSPSAAAHSKKVS